MNYKISNNIEDVPANILLDEDVLKNIWRRLSSSPSEDVFRTFSTCFDQDEYIRLSHTSSEDVFKTSSRRFAQKQYIRLGHASDVFKTLSTSPAKTSSRHLQDVLKTFWARLQDVFKASLRRFKTSSRHFQDVFKRSWRRLQDIIKTSCKYVFQNLLKKYHQVKLSC